MPTIIYKNKDGEVIPGTTTIIGQNLGWKTGGLVGWAYKQGKLGLPLRETTQKAADAGTIGHSMIESDLKGLPFSPPEGISKEIIDKSETSFLNFLEWKQNYRFKVIALEKTMVSETYQYGSCIDCVAWVNQRVSLFDWATGSDIYDDKIIQVAGAYYQNWNENNPELQITGGCHFVRLDKESGAFDHKYRDPIPEAFEVFLCLLKINNLKKAIK